MAETASDKIQSLDIEDTHGDGMYGADEGVVLTSPPSTCDLDESYAKVIPPYGLLTHSSQDGFSSSDKTDQLSDQMEYDETERLSPLSPNAIKRYGINARNDTYRPGGGNIRIFSEKVDFKNISSRIDSRSKSPRKSPPSSTQSPARQTVEGQHSSPSPSSRNVRSKIGSLDNAKHTPGGGNSKTSGKTGRYKDSARKKRSKVKIINRKEKYDAVQSRVGSKDNITHRPGGGNIKIENKRVSYLETAKPKVGSLDKVDYKPGGGDKKILDDKLEWSVQPKVGSKANLFHKPGDKTVLDEKVEWIAQPKVGSKDNIYYKPGGGDKKIEDQKLEWKVESKVGSKDNLKHVPGGGEIKIQSPKVHGKEVESNLGCISDEDHQAVGGIASSPPPPSSSLPQIEDHKLEFTENAQPKVGSKDNLIHQPGGGNVQVETHVLRFKENAEPRTNTGINKS